MLFLIAMSCIAIAKRMTVFDAVFNIYHQYQKPKQCLGICGKIVN